MKKHRLSGLKKGKPKGPAKPPPYEKEGVRKGHKEALRQARIHAELDRQHPEPMSLMQKRAKELDKMYRRADGSFVPYRKPQATLGAIEKAATASASWNNSDPFAYGRTALHYKQGYVGEEEVKEYHLRTIARRAAKVKEVEDARALEAE